MRLILLGAPGAGKGTQAEILSKKLNVPTISTGNILREAIKNGTPTGRKAKELIDKGQLAPDDIVIDIVRERLSKADCAKGYILDGMPRTLPQAVALEEHGIILDTVISIEVADDAIEERMSGRRVCGSCGASYHLTANPPREENICDSCGGQLITRKDDVPETVHQRLEIFHRDTEPLKDFYAERGVLKLINGNQPIDKTAEDIFAALGM